MTITTESIEQALADERHLGWGYACTRDIESESKRDRLDRATVAVANELGLDAETFFHWTNSKYGRWLTDAVLGRGEPPTKATVRQLLNPSAIEQATEGVKPSFPIYQTTQYAGQDFFVDDVQAESPEQALDIFCERIGFKQYERKTDGSRVIADSTTTVARFYTYATKVREEV